MNVCGPTLYQCMDVFMQVYVWREEQISYNDFLSEMKGQIG